MHKKANEIVFTSLGAIVLKDSAKAINYVTLDEISKLFQTAVGNEEEQTAVIFKGSEDCLTLHRNSKEKPLITLPYNRVVQLKRDDAIDGLIFLQYAKKGKTNILVLLLSDPSAVTELEDLIHKQNKSAILWNQPCEDQGETPFI
ncbi:unnamed protein product [Dibothriocephalus latus]|uniref:Uncharacterized protein n=1 Tax=Dibothriocephalus latus TaxID=60516 RepID=A0A3P6SG47_DIBLA|nr:unnamed protein product [Dibothriocephalus latus]